MTSTQIIREGLWDKNTSFVQLLGLCPTLAITTTVINGIGLGIATAVVLIASNLTISLIRNIVSPEVRLPVFVVVIASFVTAIDLLMKAFYYDLYQVLGIYIPLIVTNCIIIGRAEAFASKQAMGHALLDGLMMGIGFTVALMILAGLRELLGSGTLFANAELLFGTAAHWITVTVFNDYHGFLLAILPPGAFFGLGFLIAIKKAIDLRQERRASQPQLIKLVTSPQQM